MIVEGIHVLDGALLADRMTIAGPLTFPSARMHGGHDHSYTMVTCGCGEEGCFSNIVKVNVVT